MDAVVAVYSDWGIGNGQTQPVVLKADRRHFKELTAGATVIVGRKTLEDFPGGRPLAGRRNIVLSRSSPEIEGAELARSVEEALELVGSDEKCLVIGGASVYKMFYPYLDRVFITKISLSPESSVFFPNLDNEPGWVLSEEGETLTENDILYCFCTYTRQGKEL